MSPTKAPAPRKRAATTKDGRLRRIARGIGGSGPWWSKVLRWVLFLVVAAILAGALVFFILYRAIAIPDPNADFTTQNTKVYYSDGKSLIGTLSEQDRENVSLDDVPASMQAAVVAAEDRTFYKNNGIDIKGIIRAAKDNASSGQVTAGGSTITQQYVKVLYLTQERSYKRKVREAVLSIKIHNQLSKNEILEGYLNTIYFGNRAYGVQVAAQTYFDKPVQRLRYTEAAALATIINSPTYYDPYSEGGTDRMKPRYDYVIDGMEKSGAITAEQAAAAKDRLPRFAKQKIVNQRQGTKGFLLKVVEDQMDTIPEFRNTAIAGQGLRIVTSFDKGKQSEAVAAVRNVAPKIRDLNTAVVSVEPGDGGVRAMYGGADYVKDQRNWATLGVQPGSTFKAFALVAGLEDGFGLKTQLNGSSPLRIGSSVLENQGDSGGESFGRVSLEYATQKSINTAFIDLTLQLGGGNGNYAGATTNGNAEAGAAKIFTAAEQAGIPRSELPKTGTAVSALGVEPVRPVDMATGYATIAAGGKRAEWYVVKKVDDSRGDTLYEHRTRTRQTIPSDVAADALAALQKVTQAGTGTSARLQCPTAGKTGTATAGSETDQYVSSSWFVGATPKLATAVMYSRGENGNGDLEGFLSPFFGGYYPAMTFQNYMSQAVDPANCGTFPPPANIQAKKGQVYAPPTQRPTQSPSPTPSRTREPEQTTPTPTTPTPSVPTPTPTQPGGIVGGVLGG